MDIYLLRHGIAQDRADPSVRSDADRRLTEEGRAKCRAAARGLAWLGVQFTAVWTSPLIRARETAELAAPDYTAEEREVLAGGSVKELVEALTELPNKASVLLVGHEPQFSETVEYLLRIPAGEGWIDMKKAGLAHVQVDLRAWPREPAELRCLLTPKQLRALGQAAPTAD